MSYCADHIQAVCDIVKDPEVIDLGKKGGHVSVLAVNKSACLASAWVCIKTNKEKYKEEPATSQKSIKKNMTDMLSSGDLQG